MISASLRASVGAVALMLSGAAFAAQAPIQAQPSRVARHAHAPRPVTRAYVQSRAAAMFAKLDTDHDGFVTRDELNALEAQREQRADERAQRFDPAKLFARFDTDHDGTVTPAELAARKPHADRKQAPGFTGLFVRADANKDGVLTLAEFDAMGQQLKARMEHASITRAGLATRMFNLEDSNHDGRVSLAEMQQAAIARFDRLDLDHDGTITPQERQQARAIARSERQSSDQPPN